ncbi:MAG: response regulator [Comamonadaceae bacterium]|nr:response regulator [Comamonadaceae bacterium]
MSFVVPMVAGLISALAWQADDTHLFLAACSTVYLGATLHFAYKQHQLLTSALHMQFEKQSLANQLAQQMAEIQHLSAEKTRFFAAASHDLRQPLHAIVLYGAVLEKKLADRPEGAHVLRLMDAVRALGVSLDTMFDVSLLDAGSIVPDPQATPLTPVFQQLHQMFASRAEQKGLQLRLRASPLWVKTDPHLLLRVLGNLVENAIKYTHKGGVVVVARARGQQVWIDVCDTGIGIAADQLEPIFAEFYQVNNPGRDRARGLGIGLSMVRRLAVLLNHPVTVQSRLGRGSRFRLQLPTDVPPAPESRHVDAEASSPVVHLRADWAQNLPQRVLLMDDEAGIGEAALALFTAYGVDLMVVRDEAGATDAFTRASTGKPIDALIFDYRLADGVDGLEVAVGLRSRFDPQLPMLLVTGETTPERLSRARDMGVPLLTKPVTAESLLASLAALKKTV